MTPPETSQLRDLTARRRQLSIEVGASPIFDVFLALWVLSSTSKKGSSAEYDLGKRWFDSLKTSLDDDLGELMDRLSEGSGVLWMAVASLVAASESSSDVDAVLQRLEEMPAAEVRMGILREKCWDGPADVMEAVADGDLGRLDELVDSCHLSTAPDEHRQALKKVLNLDDRELVPGISLVARSVWNTDVMRGLGERMRNGLKRQEKWIVREAAQFSPKSLIERVTNGISYEVPPGVRRIVFVPSAVLKPWTVVSEVQDTLILFHALADEHLDVDADAPPIWLVRTFKALADERRMRVMRRLAAGEATLSELAEAAGVAKSTAHHHLGILRAAGLIRVLIENDQSRYALREGSLTDLEDSLSGYLAYDHETLQEEGAG